MVEKLLNIYWSTYLIKMDYKTREEEINPLYVTIKGMEANLKNNPNDSEFRLKIQGLSKRLLELENEEADDYDKALRKKLKLPFDCGRRTIEEADKLLKKYEK